MAREKTTGFYFKMTPEERVLIEEGMKLAGVINMSAFIRKMCIDGYIINLNIRQLDDIGKLLRVTANNVNQIARRVNSGGEAYRKDVAEVSGQLHDIRVSFGGVLDELSKLKNKQGKMK